MRGTSLREQDGVPFLFITPEDGSTKSGKGWITAVHPHLVQLGILDMFRDIGDGPAFYAPYPSDTDLAALPGKLRSKEAGNRVGRWITKELGIQAPGGKPSHAWRHLFTTLSRDHDMDKQARDHMLGSGPQDAREGYGDWSPGALDREISKLPNFEVELAEYRPSNQRLTARPIRMLRERPEANQRAKRR
ncbi:hypothetical protein [Mesorhizobium sp. INR15]|uniref:hypothetical protein n=1 Tax=Mesorhizobium sp. INR15 TaxID=2654248 RepID=UPI0018964AC2|nr:hypothetical protein GA829_31725 [Mesorhizobium sp. INR15]